jgi:hypothetical protein
MKAIGSRYGNLWIHQESTPVDSLEVTETNAGTVQICLGVADYNLPRERGVTAFNELLIELDPKAAEDLGARLLAVAMVSAKRVEFSKLSK